MQTTARRSHGLLLLALLALGGITIQAHKGTREATTKFIRAALRQTAKPSANQAARDGIAHSPTNAAEPAAPGQSNGNFAIAESAVLTGGGGSTGGNFTLTDSIGQLLSGMVSGGPFTLIDGFQGSGGSEPAIIASAPLTRQLGSSATTFQIATVSDPDQAANTLSVQVNDGASATVNNVTVSNLAVNASGIVTANIAVSCTATNATFTLKVTDNASLMDTAMFTVSVAPNSPPTFSAYPNRVLPVGGSGTATPSAAPADNGSVTSLTASAPGFTGTFSGNATTGVISIGNAGPAGSFPVTVTATDNCNATSTTTFTLNVGAQTITVNTTADTVAADGVCSLREAIQAANTNVIVNECNAGTSGTDSIVFNLGSVPRTITVTSALPTISEPLLLDGGAARVELNGGNLGANRAGLSIAAGNSTIRGLIINRFTGAGIQLSSQGSNTIQNCLIGVNAAGTAVLANARGIFIDNTANNLIGGSMANTSNVIAGNTQDGIQISGLGATGNQVSGNSIGTDASGALDLGNNNGVNISGASNNRIGGTSVAERNLISGNNVCGINLTQAAATGNLVQGNYIGTNANGTARIDNGTAGVCITSAPSNTIGGAEGTTPGGACTGACNLISGNNTGVRIDSVGAADNFIRGNFIGVRFDGQAALANNANGVRIIDAPTTVIGGTIAGARNVISGNSGANIAISGALATGHQIQGNFIGTNSAGTQSLANGSNGVEINGAPNVLLGGTTPEARNVISGHTNAAGVSIVSASNNQVRGNYIGTNADGTAAVSNSIGVSRIESVIGTGQENLIGGADAGAGNLISGNTSAGVQLQGQNDRVQGNLIGTNAAGTGAIPNNIGINLNNGTAINNLIGNTNIQSGANCTGACNKIAFNTGQGVLITTTANAGNRVWGNSIFSNGALGFDLAPSGATPNDAGDGDSGPNGLQNFPVLTGALTLGDGAERTTTFLGTLNSASSKLYRVEFFSNSVCDSSGNGEGQRFLGFTNVTSDRDGNAIINVTLPTPSGIAAGDFVTTTATDVTANNTSEFSACVPVFNFTPATAAFTRFANTGSFAFTTAPSASWRVASSVPWIAVTSAPTGIGNGTVTFSLTANPDVLLRTGTISVAGNLFIVTQTGTTGLIVLEDFSGTTFQPSANWNITDGGTNGGVEARWTNQNPCGRTISFPGNQNGTFAIMDAGCAGSTINVLDESLFTPPFNATGLGTVYLEFLNRFLGVGAPSNIGDVEVSTNGGTTWTLVHRFQNMDEGIPTPVLRTFNLSPFIGSATADVRVRLRYRGTGLEPAPSLLAPDAQEISWAIDFSIYAFSLTPASQSFTASGGTGNVTVSTSATVPAPQGAWTATSNAPWIILAAQGGTGNGSVGYMVSANPSASSRTGTLTIAGNTFTVTQSGTCTSATISPNSLPNGSVGTAYNQMLTGGGGVPPYTFAVSAGTLPDGLNLSSGGLLSGAPTTAGSFSFTVRATDANGCVGTQSYTLTINPLITSNGLQFYPLARPLRLLDTRPANQRPGAAFDTPGVKIAGLLSGGTDRVQQAQVSFDGLSIPANAKAIVGTATVINFPDAGGYNGTGNVTFYPSNKPKPEVSNLNYAANQTISNGFTVALGDDGAFRIFSFSDVHLVIDVVGYYAPPGAGGLYFHPLPRPLRALETRPETFYPGCETPRAKLQAGSTRPLQGHFSCEGVTIPSTARALVGNLTSVNANANGEATAYAGDVATLPLANTLSYVSTQAIPNAFVTRLSGTGNYNLYVSQTTDMLIDLTGYFSAEANDTNGQGLLLTLLETPIRILETRPELFYPGCITPRAPLAGGGETVIPALGTCGGVTIPATAKALIGNATVVNFLSPGSGNVTLYPTAANRPEASNLNYIANQVIPNAFTVGLSGDGKFTVYVFSTIHLLIDVSGYFAP